MLKSNKLKSLVIYGFVPFLMLDYFFQMFGIDLHRYLGTPFFLGLDALALYYVVQTIQGNERNTGKTLFTLLLFYSLLTVFCYLSNNRPIACYTGIIRPLIFPMLFFYIGNTNSEGDDRFYKTFLYSCIFCYVIGIVLYFTMPSFYLSYISNRRDESWIGTNSTEEYILETFRMASFLGDSYAISYTSVPAMIIGFGFLFRDCDIKKRILYIIITICFISAILSQQRSAMAFAFLSFIFFVFLGRRYKDSTVLKFGIGIAILLACMVTYFAVDPRFSLIYDNIVVRFQEMSFSDAMDSSRPDQYRAAIGACTDFFFGNGIGSLSSIARKYGYPGVSDGEYIRILVETGIIGSLLYLILILKSLLRCIRHLDQYIVEMLIVLYFLFSMIGSNSLSINYFYAIIFWYAMGRIWNLNYRTRELKQ